MCETTSSSPYANSVNKFTIESDGTTTIVYNKIEGGGHERYANFNIIVSISKNKLVIRKPRIFVVSSRLLVLSEIFYVLGRLPSILSVTKTNTRGKWMASP